MGPGVPARVSRIDLRLRPPTRLSEGDADGLLAAVEVCTVDNALLAPPNIGVRLETEARVA
ncbi:hypothetical protein [Actinomadura madurae]|nr:hypothetical protein [Actinomadura madurae]MCP9984504.1 hypothetical protein [Actinomadura madurae]